MLKFNLYRTPDGEFYNATNSQNVADRICPDKVNANDVFDEETWTWKPYEKNVEEYKIEILLKLHKYRQQEEYAGPTLPVDGRLVRFPSTVKDECRLNSVNTFFDKHPKVPAIPNWDVGTEYVIMTRELLDILREIGFLYINNTFGIERIKKDEILACATIEELDDWLQNRLTIGWEFDVSQYI